MPNLQIQLRRGTSSNWSSTNPTLAQGEPGYITDTNQMKIGDGTTAWNSLPYTNVGPTGPAGGVSVGRTLVNSMIFGR